MIQHLVAFQPDASYMLVSGDRELSLPDQDESALVSKVLYKPWQRAELLAFVRESLEGSADRWAKRFLKQAQTPLRRRPYRVCCLLKDAGEPIERALTEASSFEVKAADRPSAAMAQVALQHFDAMVVNVTGDSPEEMTFLARVRGLRVTCPSWLSLTRGMTVWWGGLCSWASTTS